MTSIEINGKSYEVKFSFKAVAACEKMFNCSISELGEHAQKVFNYPAFLQIGIAAVTGQQITIEEIETWLDSGDFERLKLAGEIIANEIVSYFGGNKEKNV